MEQQRSTSRDELEEKQKAPNNKEEQKQEEEPCGAVVYSGAADSQCYGDEELEGAWGDYGDEYGDEYQISEMAQK